MTRTCRASLHAHLLLPIFAFLLATPVAAQHAEVSGNEQADDNDRQEARSLFLDGNTAMDEGRFGEAREFFRRSLTLHPSVATAFNLAVSLERTGALVDSVELLSDLIAGEFGELSDAQRTEAIDFRDRAEPDIGIAQFRVSGAPRAEARLDGELIGHIERGRSLETEVDPGEHVIVLTARNAQPVERRFVMERGESVELTIPIEADEDGTLVVETSDDAQMITVVGVGEARGEFRQALAPGSYQVQIDGTDHEVAEVRAGQTVRLVVGERSRRRTGLIVALSVIAIAAAAGTASYFLLRDPHANPTSDPVYGTIFTLRAD